MSKINDQDIIFYLIRKSEDEGEYISAVTRVTPAFLFGVHIFSSNKDEINKTFRIAKDLVSKYIDEYDFTKSLDSY